MEPVHALIRHVQYVQQGLQVLIYVNYARMVINGIIIIVIVIYQIVNNAVKIDVSFVNPVIFIIIHQMNMRN